MSLPPAWESTPIGDLCDLINGKAFKPADWSQSGLPIIRIQNLNKAGAEFNYCNFEVDEKFIVEPGELLFAWSGTPGTSFGAHVWNGPRAVLNQHIFRVRFDESSIDRDFFKRAINSTLEELIRKAHGGVGLAHVTKGKFEATEIPFPPLAEQRRIVAKLDALTARLARARAELDRVPVLAERMRQSSLDAAFEGLGARTCTLLETVDQARGICYGIVQTGQPMDGGIPTVRGGDIKKFRIPFDALKLVDPAIAKGYRRTFLAGGEVVISIRGTIGNPAVVQDELKGCNISREVALIPVTSEWEPQYIAYLLARTASKQFLTAHTKGSAQPGINLVDLRKLPVPIAPRETQVAVVRQIAAAFARADRMEAEAARARALIDRLEAALLARAFRGELVPQDPADEPASTLLARIRTERAATPKPKRGRKLKEAAA